MHNSPTGRVCNLPEGHTGSVVDLSATPTDIAPLINEIMAKINWIMRNVPEGTKLKIVIGEYHGLPTHSLVSEALLLALHNQNEHSFSYGVEIPHSRERILPQLASGEVYNGYAPLSHKALFSLCQRRGIEVSFNDLARIGNADQTKLDIQDRVTREFIGENSDISAVSDGIFSASPNGMALRNRFMVSRMATMSRDIQIQTVGCDHVFGREKSLYAFDRSVGGILEADGEVILPIILTPERRTENLKHNPNLKSYYDVAIIAEGLDQTSFTLTEANKSRVFKEERLFYQRAVRSFSRTI